MALQHDHPSGGRDAERIAQQFVLVDAGGVGHPNVLYACPDQMRDRGSELAGLVQPVKLIPAAPSSIGPALLQHGLHFQRCRAWHWPDGVGIEIKRSWRAGIKAFACLCQADLVKVIGIQVDAISKGQWQATLQILSRQRSW